MITSAEEFIRLRFSDDGAEQARATHEAVADEIVWLEVIAQRPDLKIWVVRNKTVPLSILRLLVADDDSRVRREVAGKRKLDLPLFQILAADSDDGVRRALRTNAKCPEDLREASKS